ncbi:MAG: LysR family transcriptional regulator [Nitrospinae bacterium]|nr:LysR family transcriptional regulator [Nitrospinota bacterium]
MTLHQLRIFRAVAHHLNFTRAAQELHLSQPSASMQIQQLEEELGTPLFEKVGKRVNLSEAGRVLEGYVHRVMALLEEAREAIGELKGLKRGHLHVGASTTPGIYLLPRIMGAFKARYPGIEVFLEIANTRQVAEKILRNEIDLGFVGGELEAKGEVKAELYLTDELILVAAPGHPLAGRGEVRPEELSGEGFILREPGSATRELALKALEGKIEVKTAMELGNPEAVKQTVAAGLGVSFVSRFSVLSEIAEGKLVVVPVRGLSFKRPLFILSHRDKRPLPLVEAFLECARSVEGLLR